jgi:phospholipid transport system substrate-binding protein
MKQALRVTGLFFFVLLLPYAPAKAADASASAIVKNFYDHLTDTMKQGEKLGFAGRYKKLESVVKSTFNLPLMARFAVGPSWKDAQLAEQQKLIDAFSAFSVANYASQFTSYSGEKFDVIGEKPASGGGTIVETKLVPSSGEPVTLDYLVRPDEKGKLRIVDVFLDASISQLAVRRSEFSAIIKRDGFDALISSINEKNKKMGIGGQKTEDGSQKS